MIIREPTLMQFDVHSALRSTDSFNLILTPPCLRAQKDSFKEWPKMNIFANSISFLAKAKMSVCYTLMT